MDSLRKFYKSLGTDHLPLGDHPYLSLKLPIDAPFELKPAPGKGWGAYATRPIKAGSQIMREKALFVLNMHDEISDRVISKAVLKLAPEQIAQFCCLLFNGTRPFASMLEAFAENHFSVACGIGANGRDGRCVGFYLLHSRYNHSCVPNTKFPMTGSEWTISVAIQDICAGEEITFCYTPYLKGMTRAERLEDLGMVCRCDACSLPRREQLLSDMRRRLIRGLCYTILGVGLRGEKDAYYPSPTIINPTLKRDAEIFKVPLTRRFISMLLITHLLELEGLLDVFIFMRFHEGIGQLTDHFITMDNRRVLHVSLEKETSLGKFLASMEFWGRKDAGDDAYARMVRKKGGLYWDRIHR